MNKYITAGELAKLAGTTKRTIRWYTQKGVIKPVKINEQGYHLYTQKQVLEYQKILLLRSVGVSLLEIKNYLMKHGRLAQLFSEKKGIIKNEINEMIFNFRSLERYQRNIEKNGTLVKPQIKTFKPQNIYYIETVSDYVGIGKACQDLRNMFANPGQNFTTLAIFYDNFYKPKQSRIRVGALMKRGMKIKPEFENEVKIMNFNPGKVITYTHNGPGETLSLFWKELEKYCRLHKIKVRKNVPDFEVYRKVNKDPKKQFFEIYLPIL